MPLRPSNHLRSYYLRYQYCADFLVTIGGFDRCVNTYVRMITHALLGLVRLRIKFRFDVRFSSALRILLLREKFDAPILMYLEARNVSREGPSGDLTVSKVASHHFSPNPSSWSLSCIKPATTNVPFFVIERRLIRDMAEEGRFSWETCRSSLHKERQIVPRSNTFLFHASISSSVAFYLFSRLQLSL